MSQGKSEMNTAFKHRLNRVNTGGAAGKSRGSGILSVGLLCWEVLCLWVIEVLSYCLIRFPYPSVRQSITKRLQVREQLWLVSPRSRWLVWDQVSAALCKVGQLTYKLLERLLSLLPNLPISTLSPVFPWILGI